MNSFKKLIVGGMVVAMTLISGKVIAASDGTLGATSTGTADISLSINATYQVTGLADFSLGAYGGTGNLTANDDVCVYTNDATGTYNVTMTDNTATAGFNVSNGAADIAYSIDFNDIAGTVGTQAVTYNTALPSTGANISDPTCAAHASDNGNIRVTLLQAALQAAPAGSYSATLSVNVGP